MQEWKLNVLRPLLDGESLPTNVLDQEVVILKADTNRTQDYVFESTRLPEIRGASWQLSHLNGDFRKTNKEQQIYTALDALQGIGLNADEVIYLGGGNLLALLPNVDTAEKLTVAVEAAYPKGTGIVTIAVAYLKCTVGDLTNENTFHEKLDALETKLKFVKQQYHKSPFYERLPFAETCRSCQIRPATTLDGRIVEKDYPICHICYEKLKRGQDKSFWSEELFDDPETLAAKDLEELGNLSNGKIAFIYADGDGFGEFMQGAGNIFEFRKRSQTIAELVRRAVTNALEDLHRKSEASEHLQYELITIGGDDVLLVVPAKYAFDVAVSMMQTFENDPYDLSLSVGIAFGRFNTPVRVLRDMAAYLLKEGAKQRKHECGSQHGYLDFHDLVREGYFSESVRDHRQINSQKTEEPIFLTSRPYTLQEFEKLRQFSQKLDRALSKSMLVALSAEVEIEGRNSDRGQERSKLYFLYQYSRLGKEGDRKNVSEALAEFQPEVESTSDLDFITDWIWQARTCNETTQLVTPVQDIVMLIDLQGRGRDADYIRD